jgi:hypothetical protein
LVHLKAWRESATSGIAVQQQSGVSCGAVALGELMSLHAAVGSRIRMIDV